MKIPNNVLNELYRIEELRFGKVTIEIIIHDGKPKFRIVVEKSIVPGVYASGGTEAGEKSA